MPHKTWYDCNKSTIEVVSTALHCYPDTVNLKAIVHFSTEIRPYIELEPTDHPLAVEYRNEVTIVRGHNR